MLEVKDSLSSSVGTALFCGKIEYTLVDSHPFIEIDHGNKLIKLSLEKTLPAGVYYFTLRAILSDFISVFADSTLKLTVVDPPA